jgi:hypothetical protein
MILRVLGLCTVLYKGEISFIIVESRDSYYNGSIK